MVNFQILCALSQRSALCGTRLWYFVHFLNLFGINGKKSYITQDPCNDTIDTAVHVKINHDGICSTAEKCKNVVELSSKNEFMAVALTKPTHSGRAGREFITRSRRRRGGWWLRRGSSKNSVNCVFFLFSGRIVSWLPNAFASMRFPRRSRVPYDDDCVRNERDS